MVSVGHVVLVGPWGLRGSVTDFLGELKHLCYQEHKHLSEARPLSPEIQVLVCVRAGVCPCIPACT